jgi:phage protein D
LRREAARPFDLGQPPLLRVLLFGGSDSGAALAQQVLGADPWVVVVDPPGTPEEADLMARATFNTFVFDAVAGEGVCIGNPTVAAGTVVGIKEVGQRFGGTYYVTASTHTVSKRKGYTTWFQVRRSAS